MRDNSGPHTKKQHDQKLETNHNVAETNPINRSKIPNNKSCGKDNKEKRGKHIAGIRKIDFKGKATGNQMKAVGNLVDIIGETNIDNWIASMTNVRITNGPTQLAGKNK